MALFFFGMRRRFAGEEHVYGVPEEGRPASRGFQEVGAFLLCYSALRTFFTQEACPGFSFLRVFVFSYPSVSLSEQVKYFRIVRLRLGESLKLLDHIFKAATGNLHFRQTELRF